MSNYSRRDRNGRDDDFSFEIVESLAKLGETKRTGYTKELNYVSFQGAEPKWDLREWNEDHTRMSKGITLSNREIRDLFAASGEVLKRIGGANPMEGKEEATA